VPTILSHAVVATAIGQWFPGRTLPARFWVWTAACAMLPDADVISFSFGIPYEAMLGHRGLSHSIPFAVVVGLVAARSCATADSQGAGSPGLGVLWLYFSAITASHGLLDAFTNGGRGIAFFAPLSDHRYFFPWRPIQVSPIGVRFFGGRGLDVLISEMQWVWLPSAIIALLARTLGKPARRASRELRSEGGPGG
jgi:inner membrane protein